MPMLTPHEQRQLHYKHVAEVFEKDASEIDSEKYPESKMKWEVHRYLRSIAAFILNGDADIPEIRKAFYEAKTTNDMRNLAKQVRALIVDTVQQSDKKSYCHQCGAEYATDSVGVTRHKSTKEDGHDLDADHTPYGLE